MSVWVCCFLCTSMSLWMPLCLYFYVFLHVCLNVSLYVSLSMSVCMSSLAPSGRSPYSEVSSLHAPLHNGHPQDCRNMYNPMTPNPRINPNSGVNPMDQYMRPPLAPPLHSMMGHRSMNQSSDGESTVLRHVKHFLNLPSL